MRFFSYGNTTKAEIVFRTKEESFKSQNYRYDDKDDIHIMKGVKNRNSIDGISVITLYNPKLIIMIDDNIKEDNEVIRIDNTEDFLKYLIDKIEKKEWKFHPWSPCQDVNKINEYYINLISKKE